MKKPLNITLLGVQTHNLKHIDVHIPYEQMTVITGVSGSGKSSLAFATLYAEGQRRFLESLSAYSRQFFKSSLRPEVDTVQGIPPAIAFEQKNSVRHARSTVGTATELNDYLKLLFATVGQTLCPNCNWEAVRDTPQHLTQHWHEQPKVEPVWICVSLPKDAGFLPVKELCLQRGYSYAYLAGARVDLSERTAWNETEPLRIVIDRIETGRAERSRWLDAFEQAFAFGQGSIELWMGEDLVYTVEPSLHCAKCQKKFETPEPQWFSFNSALGACAQCQGYGRLIDVDLAKVINPAAGLAFGAVIPFGQAASEHWQEQLLAYCQKLRIATHMPYRSLKQEQRNAIENGDPEHGWPGVRDFFKQLERYRYKVHVRVMLARYRAYIPCPSCQGNRLKAEALWVKVEGHSIGDLWNLPLPKLHELLVNLPLSKTNQAKVHVVWHELIKRVSYLCDIGLTYLHLGRATRTLSGGESQRLKIASALGHGLCNSLYVLDEPTVGLHARDVDQMTRLLKQIVAQKNTVVVVEHAPEVIRAAEHIIELGPGAGELGGKITAQGPLTKVLENAGNRTAQLLQGLPFERTFKPRSLRQSLVIHNARARNLKNLTVTIPLQRLVCLSGVSGSGKSTLLKHILFGNVAYLRGDTEVEKGACDEIEGLQHVDELLLIDQSPVSGTVRSNAATLMGVYTPIRELLARTSGAISQRVGASYFSFNVSGGRCPVCEGRGEVTVDMQFLDDLIMECDACHGKRFGAIALAIRYRGKNINDILNMTVQQALMFFRDQKKIVHGLQPLQRVGLGYLRLGQSTATLSGGEAQRLKLANILAGQKSNRRYLLLLDEPTTGLHHSDVQVLLNVLDELLREGHSLLVIEHHLDFLRACDYLIDLGPEGGENGGKIVAEGAMPGVLKSRKSLTVKYLTG